MQRIISQTPVRISFFGGGTDYPSYYQRNRGAALGLTIDKYIYVSINSVSRFFDYRLRVSYAKIEVVNSVDEIEHPSVRSCLQHKGILSPLDIHISADLPAKTGLGSSSAFTVGFLNALYALQGTKASKQRLAEEACYIEQGVIGENVGSQDQYHAAFGGINVFEFYPDRTQARPVILSADKKNALHRHLLIFYTGMTRFASEVVQEQLEKTKASINDDDLEKMYEMVFEGEDILSKASCEEMPQLLGKLLHESWLLKRRLSSKISNPIIDRYYEAALASGAYGGKLCGAGGGGFLVFFVPDQAIPKVRESLKNLLEVDFSLESQGSTIIYMKE